MVNTNGSGDRNLTPTLDRIVAFAISPSWNEVAVAGRAGGGGREIYVLDTDGTNLRRLTDNGVLQDDDPQWSSDGRKIAFVRWGPVTNPEIFVINADGTDQTNVSRHPAPDEGPAWQPAPHPAGSLPMTGLDVIAVALGGLALFASGVLIRAVELRRRPDLDG